VWSMTHVGRRTSFVRRQVRRLHSIEHLDVDFAPAVQLQQSQAATDEHIKQTLARTREHLASARELSLVRHALADELSSLSSDLVSPLNREERPKPTLLEELESLHRSLKELESVRSYVAVIERALRLR
jgi:hypothetical protein